MYKLIKLVCVFAHFITLGTAGIFYNDWQWWGCAVCLFVYGLCSLIEGMEER